MGRQKAKTRGQAIGQPQKTKKAKKSIDGRRRWLSGISRRSIALKLPLEFGSRPIRSPPQLPIPALPSQICRRLRFLKDNMKGSTHLKAPRGSLCCGISYLYEHKVLPIVALVLLPLCSL